MHGRTKRAMNESMITWLLVEEPTDAVARAIDVVEARLGSEGEIAWVSPVIDPEQA